MLHLRRTLLMAAVVLLASLLSLGCSATDVHEGAAAASRGRELDEMKCTCFPCGGPCYYPSPPPPPPSPPPPSPEPYTPPEPYYTPPEPYCPPQPWSPPQPWTPPQPWSPPYYWLTPPGTLYPVDQAFMSGARRSYANGGLLLLQVVLAGCGLLAVWI